MTTARTIELDQLHTLLGQPLGPSPWRDITQEAVNAFAEATGDHQWIHVDIDRAAHGPFGGTIAHGFMTLALIPILTADLLDVQGTALAVNYGLDKVRFPAPVPVGTAVRATGELTVVDPIQGGVQGKMTLVIERDGGAKPVCVAEPVFRFYC